MNKTKPMDMARPWSDTTAPEFSFAKSIMEGARSTSSLKFGLCGRSDESDGEVGVVTTQLSDDTVNRPNMCKTFMAIAASIVGSASELHGYTRLVVSRHQSHGQNSMRQGCNIGKGSLVICLCDKASMPTCAVFYVADIGMALEVRECLYAPVLIPLGAPYGFVPAWGSDGKTIDGEVISLVFNAVRPTTAFSDDTWRDAVAVGFSGPKPQITERMPSANIAAKWSQSKANACVLYKRFETQSVPGFQDLQNARADLRAKRKLAARPGYCVHCECDGCVAKRPRQGA